MGMALSRVGVSNVALPSDAAPEGGPLPVRAKRAPIVPIYGDDVPVYEATRRHLGYHPLPHRPPPKDRNT
jgi:hypothetical protein